MSERRSRRTRGERPELVPPKSDEEPNLEDDYVDKDGNKIALGALRGRRRGRRSRSKGPRSSSTGALSKGTSSSSSPSQADRETQQDSPKVARATTAKKRGRPRGRPPNNRSRSPTPSQSSLSMFGGSASESIADEEVGDEDEDEDEDEDDTMDSESNVFEESNKVGDEDEDEDEDEDDTMDSESNVFEESNDSDNIEDDAERDTEDDAPKEALTGRKKRGRPKKQKATKYDDEEKHPRYKNSMKVQCRYCGKSLFSQGIKVHERHCMRVNREDSAVADEKPKARKKSSSSSNSSSSSSRDSRRSSSGSSSSSSSSDSSSPPSPVVIVRKKLGRPKKTATNARKATTVPAEPVKPFICRNCGRFFTARGINAHEKRCMPVYTERESSSPDTSPFKKKEEGNEEKSQLELDEQKPLDKAAASSLEKDEKISNGPPQKPVFPCRYCGRMFKAQGLKKHERSCLKKKRERIMSENVKAKLGVQKGETKKGKKADKGATKSAANADSNDDSSWEDDASSTANDKTASGDNTTSNAGKFITAKKPNNNGSSETLSSATPKKRKRKWKNQSDTNEIEEKVVVSDAMVDAGEDASPNSVADNASRKQAKKPKTRDGIVSVEKTPKDGGRIKSDKVDSLATASAVAVTTKTRKKSLNANAISGAIDSGKVDTYDATDEKARAKKEKTKAGRKSALAPSTTSKKNASITAFFPRKASTKPKTEQLEGKSQEGRGNATGAVKPIPLSEKQEGAQTDPNKFVPASATTTSGENKVKGESIQNQECKGDETKSNSLSASSETVSAESAPTGHVAKDGADGVDRKKNAVASSMVAGEPSTIKSEPSNDGSKREERTSETNEEPDVVTKIASDAIVDTDSITLNDEGGSVAGKGNKGREQITGAVTLNTRPTRKRKLTPKAAQAAAILAKASAIRDEKLMVDDGRNGVTVVESQRVREKKLKTTHTDNVESDGDAPDKGITTASDVERSAKPKRNDSPTEAGESKASGHDDKVENHSALDIMNHAELPREDHGDQSAPKDSAQDSGEQKVSERNEDESSPNDSLPYSDQPKVPDDEHGNKSTPDKNLTKVLVSEHMDESKSNIIPPLSDQPKTLECEQSDQLEHNVSLPDGDQPKASGAHCGDESKSEVSPPVTDQPERSDLESRDKTPSSVSPINIDQPKASDSELRDTSESNASSTDGDQQKVPDAELKDKREFCGSPPESDMQKQSHTKHNNDSKSQADADQSKTSDAEHEDKSLSHHDSKVVGNLRKEVCVDDNDQPQRAAYISQPKALEIENQTKPECKGSKSVTIHKTDVDNVHKTQSQRPTGSGIIVEAAKSAATATWAAFSIFSSKGKSDRAVNQLETEKNAVVTITTTQVEKQSNASPVAVVNHSGQQGRTMTAGDNESACDDKNSAVCNEAPNTTTANTTSSNLIEIGRNAESIEAAPGISKDGTHQTSSLPTSTTENIQTVVSSKFEASSNGNYEPTYNEKVDALKSEVQVTPATAKANNEVAEDGNLQPEHRGTELGNKKIPSVEGQDSNEKKESQLLTQAHSSEKRSVAEKKQMSDSLIDTNDMSTLPPLTASRLDNQDGSPLAVEDPKRGIDAEDANKVSKKVEMSNPTRVRVESKVIPSEKTGVDIVASGRNNNIGDDEGDERHDSDTKLWMATTSISEKPKTDTTVESEVEEAKTSMDEAQTHGFDIRQSANHLTGEGMQEKAEVHTANKESFPESNIDAVEPSEATLSQNTECSVKNDHGSMSYDAKTEHRGQKLSTLRKVTTDGMNMNESHANDLLNVERGNNKDQAEGNTEKRDAIENEKIGMKQSTVEDESKAERPTYDTAAELPPKLHLNVGDSQKSVNDSTRRSISHGSLDSSSKEKDAAPEEASTVVEYSVPKKPSQNVSAVELDIKRVRKESHSSEVEASAFCNDEVQSTVINSKTAKDGSKMSSPPKNIESNIHDSNDASQQFREDTSKDLSKKSGISAMKVAQTTSHNEDNLMEGKDEVVNRSVDPVEEKGGTKLASDDKTGSSKDSDKIAILDTGGTSKVDTSSKVKEGNDVIGNCNDNSNKPDFSNKNENDTQMEGEGILSGTICQRTVLTGQRRAENVVTDFATEEELEKSEIKEAMPQINHRAEESLESASEAKKTRSNEAPPVPTAVDGGRSSEENELEVGEGGSSKINPKVLDLSSIGDTGLATAIPGEADEVSNGAKPLSKAGRSENRAKSLDTTVNDEPSAKSQSISSDTDAERPENGMTMSQDQSQLALEGQNDTLLSSVRSDAALELVSNGNDSSVAANGEKMLSLSVDKTDNEQDAAGEKKVEMKGKGVSNVGATSIEISGSPTDKSNVTNTCELPVTSTESKLGCSSADTPDMHVDFSREPIAKVHSNDAVPMEFDESNYSAGNDEGEQPPALVAHRLKDDPTKVRINAKSPGVTFTIDHSTMLDEPESIVRSEARKEVELRTKDAILPDTEKVQVSWVPLSKVSRHSRPAQRSSSLTEFDQCKVNRVKMLLYTTGSQVHRGKGFERIFAMYWDAICLRLSSPLSINASKRCDDAISEFLKSRRLRKIHNKLIMNVMRHTLKQRILFTDVSQHIPLKWQDRVKIPQVMTATKQPKVKRSPRFGPFKDNLLQISSVPHFNKQIPYREVWDIPEDGTDKKEQNPQEGPTELVASSCIPGALVIDPAIRDIVQDNGMKVTDNAMWLLTVALKEHIKNLLNDSIEYKKGLEKGEIYPQTIHYPNVLATTSTKSKKNSKGKTLTTTQDAGEKKHISSIDLFAALNMLPSGQSSSIGGSVSRMSLEHTFLSGFNSMQSFNTGSVFKDVQSFISSEITTMSKERIPHEKKAKTSLTKSSENRADASRETKAEGGEEQKKKPPPPIAVKASEPISSPISTTDSKALVSNLSPSIVHTPLMGMHHPPVSTPVTDKSLATPQVVKTPESGSNDNLRADSSAGGSQGIKEDTKDGSEVKVVKITKPIEKATKGVQPTQSAVPRSGAGRGAKNLAALMARAAETNTPKESTESAIGGERASTNNPAAMIDNKFAASSNTNVKVSTSGMPKPDTGQIQMKQSQHEANSNRARQTTESLTHSRPNPNSAAESAHSDINEGANKEAPFPVSKRQPNAPVRRGSGKGFGSKDLAAMRARSMGTNKPAETNTAESAKDKLTEIRES
eukprot:CAMPEP_0172409548 /NCGR_PEP_ID=MMETSP1061-20121228/76423_1 /TAXON_ID=37318 /ORGANISM="Pseudo-nitzschia pungens, Strain cf. pungens" /LENGTH=3152 /DNA_ID=CAMNT_0013145703 /DNA_START=288 /DNA_END=9746 /DNA_ORIENTATION=+